MKPRAKPPTLQLTGKPGTLTEHLSLQPRTAWQESSGICKAAAARGTEWTHLGRPLGSQTAFVQTQT